MSNPKDQRTANAIQMQIRPGRGPGGPGGPGRFVKGEKPKNLKNTIMRIWKYMRRHKLTILVCFVLLLISTGLGILGPLLLGKAINDYIVMYNFGGLQKLLVALAAVYLSNSLITYLQTISFVRVGQDAVTDMRRDLFDKMQNLPLKFFDSHTHGELMSRVTNDIDNVSNMLNSSLGQIISGVVNIIGTFAVMLWLSPWMTLAAILMMPVMYVTTRAITKFTRKYFTANQVMLGRLNGKVEEIISGQKVVKVFSREEQEIAEFNRINEELNEVGIKSQIFAGITGPTMNALNNMSFMLVVVTGGILVINFGVEVGLITSFSIYARQFIRPINELAQQYNSILSAVAGAERVFQIIDEEPEPADVKGAIELKDIKGMVELEHVDFSYIEGHPVLKDICLYAKPGQTIALVGPTGAGKTTIMNLLTRFYDIEGGTIKIDGVDITKLKREYLRRSLSIVLQDTYLFAGTIRDNIRYGRLDATDEEIIAAAKLANAHEFVRRLLHGYDTELSENADNLSQGQKQMIAIARAILADPAILVLDEATSNVDTRTEQKIQQAMINLMKNRTCFVIAHRLSTIRNADLIAVINDGEIVERGNHEELLEKQGVYYGMYMSQFNAAGA